MSLFKIKVILQIVCISGTIICFSLPLMVATPHFAFSQIITPGNNRITPHQLSPSGRLLEYRIVSQEEMNVWPVDKVRSGEKLWAETTWGSDDSYTGSHTLFKRLYNYNIWPNRVVFNIKEDGDVARGTAFWRRSKLSIRVKGLKLVSAKTGEEIHDAMLVHYNQEKVIIDFRPVSGPGSYYLYYCALEQQLFYPSKSWLEKRKTIDKPVIAQAERIEARCALDSFYPMETVPLEVELKKLLENYSDAPYLVFPQDRNQPIRMVHEIPANWVFRNPSESFVLDADRNEYRVFQLGIWACRKSLSDVEVIFSDFEAESGTARITSSRFQCLTLTSHVKNPEILKPEGPFPVARSQVFHVWCGIDLPGNCVSGTYHGTVTVRPEGQLAANVPVTLHVSNTIVDEHGDHDLWRLSRLRWLESDLGVRDEVFPPFTPLVTSRNTRSISTWGHTLVLNEYGLPENICFKNEKILAAPISLTYAGNWGKPAFKFITLSDTHVSWQGTAKSKDISLIIDGSMEFEGTVTLKFHLESANRKCTVKDLNFTASYRKEKAELISCVGYQGKRSKKFICGFGGTSVWMGSMKAGMGIYGIGIPFEDASRIDASSITEENNAVTMRLKIGTHTVSLGDPIEFKITLRPTPVKPPDKRHWQFRYLHMSGHPVPADNNTPQSYLKDNCRRLDELLDLGVTQLNLHDWWGPSFNYPWQWEGPDNLSRLTEEAHKRGLKVKVYNSGRELSTTAPEFWALIWEGTWYVFNQEINPEPPTIYRDAWTISHLPDGITEGWPRVHDLGNEHAVPINMGSRLGNFYLEGIRYITKNFGTDGVYSDGAVGRLDIAKRLRNIFNECKPDATIDVHGSALGYIQVLPYIDSVWNGEGVRYDLIDPWQWLVDVSGLPFGIPSEMLTGEQYMDRGMLFGIWPRMGWGAGTERQRKLWAFFDKFGIQDADMRGWWEDDNGIYANNQEVYVTAFVHARNGVLMSVANWHSPFVKWTEQVLNISFRIDRKALGLPESPLRATDIITGEELDLSKPVPFREPEEHIESVFPEYFSLIKPFFEGRIIWVRGE